MTASDTSPVVGMGATIHFCNTSRAYTVIKILSGGKRVVLQRDRALRTDSNGEMHAFEADPNGKITQARLTKQGNWYEVGAPCSRGGYPLTMGRRLEQDDGGH